MDCYLNKFNKGEILKKNIYSQLVYTLWKQNLILVHCSNCDMIAKESND